MAREIVALPTLEQLCHGSDRGNLLGECEQSRPLNPLGRLAQERGELGAVAVGARLAGFDFHELPASWEHLDPYRQLAIVEVRRQREPQAAAVLCQYDFIRIRLIHFSPSASQ